MTEAKDVLAEAAGESLAVKEAKKAPMTQDELDKRKKLEELEKQAADEKAQRAQRVYKNATELDHDLFKLEPAIMKKNVSFTDVPSYVNVEHCHIYHTISSDGKKQVKCTPTGGHFHLVEVVKEATDTEPPVLKVGPPLKEVWQRDRYTRKTKRVTVAFDEADDHRHPIVYVRSEKIRPRKLNNEFVKFQASQGAPKVSPEIKA